MITEILDRQRLLDSINQPSLAPVTLITAPAGYGKSTLARQWAASFPGPVASISLTPESNTLSRLLSQALTALHHAAPDVPAPETSDPSLGQVFQFGEHIVMQAGTLGIILDDYHVIESEDIHSIVNNWFTRVFPGIHVLILSRTMPPLALGRLRVQGQVRHLTEADLGFTRDEVACLTQSFRLSPDQVQQLTTRTEGWITGIHLALLSMNQDHGPDKDLDRILASTPHQQWLDDYIVEEVLNALPGDLREFVLQTSILETLIPELCDAMLGIKTSGRLLHRLEQQLVFVNRSSASTGHLAYHHLFAEAARRISHRFFTSGQRRQHHLRAARWLEDHDDPERALSHALRAGEWDMVNRLMPPICEALSQEVQPHAMLFWLSKLPLRMRRADTRYSWWYVRALMGSGNLQAGTRELETIRPRLEASGSPVHHAYIAYLEGSRDVFTGENDRVLESFYTVLNDLPPDLLAEHLLAWTVVFQFESLRGNDDAAEHAWREASALLPHFATSENPWPLHLASNRANHYALRADLVTAEALYRQLVEKLSISQQYLGARYRGFLAMIYLEWNEIDRALAEIRQVLDDIGDTPIEAWHSELLLFAARISWAAGDHDSARQLFHRISAHYRTYGGENTMQRAEALRVVHQLASGEIALARDWVARQPLPENPLERVFGEHDLRLPWIALYVADKRWDEANTLVREILASARATRHQPTLVRFSVWQAIIADGMGDTATARGALTEAIRIGAPGRFVRAFYPLGHDLRNQLRQLKPSLTADEAAWVDHLILRGPRPDSVETKPEAIDSPPAVRLTPSEERVLAFLDEGYTNPQIGDALHITERTVKKHVSNILRKLDVPNRTAAVTRATELDLL